MLTLELQCIFRNDTLTLSFWYSSVIIKRKDNLPLSSWQGKITIVHLQVNLMDFPCKAIIKNKCVIFSENNVLEVTTKLVSRSNQWIKETIKGRKGGIHKEKARFPLILLALNLSIGYLMDIKLSHIQQDFGICLVTDTI